MRLEHQFSVPASPEVVWAAVTDPERVAPCMPGATLTGVDGAEFTGGVKVKLGPISLLYKGSGQFVETDEQVRRVVIKAAGKDSRGNGTAAATVTVTLVAEGEGDRTVGTVVTDLTITGKPAQFGRGLIAEVGGKILDTFAECLAGKLAPQAEPAGEADELSGADAPKPKPAIRRRTPAKTATPEPAAAEAEAPQAEPEPPRLQLVDEPAPETEPIDLLDYAAPSVAKRLVPVAVLLIVLVVWLRRRARSNR